MQNKNLRTVSIVGGTYREICNASLGWNHVYGSGLRATLLFKAFHDYNRITFHSCCHSTRESIIYKYGDETLNFDLQDGEDVLFNYEHPFRVSAIEPRPDFLYENRKNIAVTDENILVYGMLDAEFHVNAKKAVYDPQTSIMPTLFTQCSKAEELVYVLNMGEAKVISEAEEIKDICNFFFSHEKCFALIIKDGANGAYVFCDKDDEGTLIPVYKTNHVFTIGSGDIFTATFSHHWFKGEGLVESAIEASKAAACYSDCGGDIDKIPTLLEDFSFPSLKPVSKRGQVYLAGPFFTFGQKWIINEFYFSLRSEGMNVFSPLHCVGIGEPKDVVEPDLRGLNDSKVIMAVLDGTDPGTVFEVGYAIAKGKKVVAYVENTNYHSLTMLLGTGCDIEKDFTTAVFKACWYAAE